MRSERGQSAAEFALVLPFALLLVLLVVEVALTGVRSVVATHAAYRSARVAEVYQAEHAEGELYAMLPPALFRGGIVAPAAAGGEELAIEAAARPVARLAPLTPAAVVRRSASRGRALPDDLPESALRGGDTPSPYCREGGGYRACGYPE